MAVRLLLPVRKSILGGLLAFILLAVLYSPRSFYPARWNPWHYEHTVETLLVEHDAAEQDCLRRIHHPESSSSSRIPRKVHFNFLHPRDGGKSPQFGLIYYLAVKAALLKINPEQILFHYSSDEIHNYPYIKRLLPHLTLVKHDLDDLATRYDEMIGRSVSWQTVAVADVLSLEYMRSDGGIYLDLDVISLKSFDSLLNSSQSAIMGHEGGNRAGLCHAVMIARPGSPFITRWLDEYKSFDPTTEWNEHAVLLPQQLSVQYPDEMCALGPRAFFWPTWTLNHVDEMHEVLSVEQAMEVKREIERNGGALYEDQLAYHVWMQVSWGPYVQYLDEERIRSVDTRFNLLVRQFLD